MSKYKITDTDRERLREVHGKPFNDHRLDPASLSGFLRGYEYAKNEGQNNDFNSELDRLIEKWEGEYSSRLIEMSLNMKVSPTSLFNKIKLEQAETVLSVLRELKEAVEEKKNGK